MLSSGKALFGSLLLVGAIGMSLATSNGPVTETLDVTVSSPMPSSPDDVGEEVLVPSPAEANVREADEEPATQSLDEVLAGMDFSGHELAHIRKAAMANGVDLSEDASWLKSWDEVASEMRTKYFTCTDDELTRLETMHTGRLFEGGVVSEEEVHKFIWRDGYEVTPEDLARAQVIVDETYPEVRAQARQVALEVAAAREAIWQRQMFSKSPLATLPVDESPNEGKQLLGGTGGASGGWCISYNLYRDDFPALDESLNQLERIKKSQREAMARAFAMD